MTAWIERLVVAWLRAVAPRGWTDAVLGDLREDTAAAGRRARLSILFPTAAVAARFTIEAAAARMRRSPNKVRTRRGNMDILTDLRQAARALARTPGFSFVAIVTLALAIGANTAIYSALSSLVLNPLPFKDGERFVFLWQASREAHGFSLSPRREVAEHWRQARHVFEALEYYADRLMTLTGSGEPEQVSVTFLRPSTLATLGVEPIIGRTFVAGDTEPAAAPVAIISHALWQSRFGGDSSVPGKTVRLSGIDYAIVGVMPPGFALPLGSDVMWVAERRGVDNPHGFGVSTIAKLAPGVTVEQAQAALDAMPPPPDAGGEDVWSEGRSPLVQSPADHHGKGLRTAMFVLAGAVGLLLLIACVNVANLTLARFGGRRREIAVRHALGASRGRIARYLLAESALLAASGGLAGIAVAAAGLQAMSSLRPENLDMLERLTLDSNALAFAATATIVTGLLFGIGPALSASRTDLNDVMKIGGRTATVSGHRVRGLLTAAQVALALVLLVGAGLLIRSYAKLTSINPGYNAHGVLAVDVSLPAARYPDTNPAGRRQFFDAALDSIASLPGVTVAAVGSLPVRPVVMLAELSIEGRPDVQKRRQMLAGGYITPSYFDVLEIAVKEGRPFTTDDAAGRPTVVIINEAFAKEYWPGESAVGKRFGDEGSWTIVGVVSDVKFGGFTGMAAGQLQMYFPSGQAGNAFGTFIIRTSGDPMALASAVKASIWRHDPEIPLTRIATAEQLLARSASERRFNLVLLALFATCGLLLAVVGVYGVTALFVGQRQREVGIRMALGATRAAVAALVLRQTAMILGSAVAAGGAGAWWLSRYLESMVFATATTDALTFAAAIAAVVIASIAATLVPLRRATSVDPAIVLRAE